MGPNSQGSPFEGSNCIRGGVEWDPTLRNTLKQQELLLLQQVLAIFGIKPEPSTLNLGDHHGLALQGDPVGSIQLKKVKVFCLLGPWMSYLFFRV